MSQSLSVTGAHIKVYLNGNVYTAVQNITYTIDRGSEELFGVDAMFPQEIITKRVTCNGSISGLVISQSGGLQAKGVTSLMNDILKQPYISLRIQNRKTGEDLLLIPKCVIASETFTANAKQTVKLSFNFRGVVALQPLDRV